MARFLRSLMRSGELGGPPRGLTLEQIVRILVRAAEGVKHDSALGGERSAFEHRLRELATLVTAAMKR